MAIRLLHTERLAFQAFHTDDFSKVPKYVILSHVWDKDDEEMSYSSFVSAYSTANVPHDRQNSSFRKILSFCRLAAADGFEYVWADTCCIDKTNKVEVSIAINSMYRWYRNSTVCYAYLADVPAGDTLEVIGSAFRQSRWFTRGWTLQELIAPTSVIFYSTDWKRLGTKAALRHTISDITGISEHVLENGDLSTASVSMKLSWAATRKTTRVEDQAYCLFGFFNIFLPPIYGERERAFQRLLYEIASTNNDQSIFAWKGNGRPCGMLPSSPAQYIPSRDASAVIPIIRNPVFALTNRGVRMNAPLIVLPLHNMYALVLNCLPTVSSPEAPDTFFVHSIYRLYDDHNDYVRVHSDQLVYFPARLKAAPPPLLAPTELFVDKPQTPNFSMNKNVVFRLKRYPLDGSRPAFCVLGPSSTAGNFSPMPQSPDQPYLVTMQLNDQMPSAVLLFKSDAGQQIAACLTLWGQEIKVGLSAKFVDDDMSQIADAFLFGKRPMVIKQPGSFSVHASPRLWKKVSFVLDDPTDHASLGTVCDVSLSADSGFWLHAVGPGVWPGCWTRYFDSLATATPGKERAWLCRRGTLQGLAQVLMVLVLVASSINTYTKYNT